jgi:TonB family protein
MRTWTLLALMSVALTTPSAIPLAAQSRAFVDLDYPTEALAARVTGTVVVRAQTDASGRVTEAEPLSGPAALRPAAVANVRQWTFGPELRTTIVVYRFEIDLAKCNDDSRSLFRPVYPNLALVTVCTGPGRAHVSNAQDDLPIESYGTAPQYPSIAKGTLTAGVVVLDLSADATGQVTEARLLSSPRFLAESAVNHVQTWRVKTTTARRGVVTYEFALDETLCTPDDINRTIFRRVSTDHVRLGVCRWILSNATGESRKNDGA